MFIYFYFIKFLPKSKSTLEFWIRHCLSWVQTCLDHSYLTFSVKEHLEVIEIVLVHSGSSSSSQNTFLAMMTVSCLDHSSTITDSDPGLPKTKKKLLSERLFESNYIETQKALIQKHNLVHHITLDTVTNEGMLFIPKGIESPYTLTYYNEFNSQNSPPPPSHTQNLSIC